MFYDEYSSETFAATIRKYMTDKFVQSETAQFVQSQTGQMPNILTLTTLTNHIEILCRCKRVEERLFYILYAHKEHLTQEGVHSMFLRKKNLKFFCCSFEKNVFLRMCIQQQMRMFSMSH